MYIWRNYQGAERKNKENYLKEPREKKKKTQKNERSSACV